MFRELVRPFGDLRGCEGGKALRNALVLLFAQPADLLFKLGYLRGGLLRRSAAKRFLVAVDLLLQLLDLRLLAAKGRTVGSTDGNPHRARRDQGGQNEVIPRHNNLHGEARESPSTDARSQLRHSNG